jgi:hypothetical protein
MLIRTSNLNFSGEFNQIKDLKLLTGVDWLMPKNEIVIEGKSGIELVEGIDYILDMEKGQITITSEGFSKFPAIIMVPYDSGLICCPVCHGSGKIPKPEKDDNAKKFYPMDCGVQGNKKPETLF